APAARRARRAAPLPSRPSASPAPGTRTRGSFLWLPAVELPRLRVLRRLPRVRVVRLDVRIELPGDVLEQVVVADAVDGLREIVVGLDQMDVDVVEHVQTPMPHARDLRQ